MPYLTWDPREPAPFESAWSIFLKILSINQITMQELARLIKKEKFENSNNDLHLDSNWIDFKKFSNLIDVSETKLRNGFLDQNGFTPTRMSSPVKHKMRHCTECELLGYHSVLFDLPYLQECPWHGRKLTLPCKRCSSLICFERSWLSSQIQVCTECQASVSYYLLVPRKNLIDQRLRDEIYGTCKEFIEWWSTVRKKTTDCPQFTDGIVNQNETQFEGHDCVPWQLGFAKQISPTKHRCKFSINEKPVILISWKCVIERTMDKQPNSQRYYLWDEVGRSYKSMCRYIYKKYLRPHCSCIKHMQSLSRHESLFFQSDEVCLPALGFLIWRMSVERMCNIEGLECRKNRKFSLRLMLPDLWPYELSRKDKIRWTFFGFFGVLAMLEELHTYYPCLRVDMRWEDEFDGFLQYRSIHDPQQSKEPTLPRQTESARNIKLQILVPKPLCLNDVACQKWKNMSEECASRKYRDKLDCVETEWTWANYEPGYHRSLFGLVGRGRKRRTLCRYLSV